MCGAMFDPPKIHKRSCCLFSSLYLSETLHGTATLKPKFVIFIQKVAIACSGDVTIYYSNLHLVVKHYVSEVAGFVPSDCDVAMAV